MTSKTWVLLNEKTNPTPRRPRGRARALPPPIDARRPLDTYLIAVMFRRSKEKADAAGGSSSPRPTSPSPPRGPFVLPKDRTPRRKSGATADGAHDGGSEAWCNWMCRLCTYKEAPEWAVHNKNILTGYRDTNTFRGALRSVRLVSSRLVLRDALADIVWRGVT